jgi:hypothetical protein
MAAKSAAAGPGGAGQEGHVPPSGADVPVVVEDFPVEQVPGDWKGYWAMGKDLYPKLMPENQRKLALAMNDFASAVKSGNADAIESKGYLLQDTISEVRLPTP